MIKKKILGALTSLACAAGVFACFPSTSASAAVVYGPETEDNTGIIYRTVDIEGDNRPDYSEIVGCKEGTKTITIPPTAGDLPLRSYVNGCFNQTTNSDLAEINVSSQNGYFSAENGVLFSKDGTVLYSCPIGKPIVSYTVPSKVTVIESAAFQSCEKLSSINLSSGINVIGNAAFNGCAALGTITIPTSVNSIGAYAFEGTEILKKQVINETGPLFYADTWVIKCDTSVTTVIDDSTPIKAGTCGIADNTFMGCSKLTEITIPDSVNYIGDYAFSGCTSLSKINGAKKIATIGDYTFKNCSSIIDFELTDTVRAIGEGSFQSCSGLNSITLSNNITEIAANTFDGCKSLLKIELPVKVASIGDKAFYNCSNLKSITINNKDCEIFDHKDTISNTETVIYGVEGSKASTYANNYQRVFEKIGTSIVTPDYPRGDANKDGKLDVRDAAYIARFAAQDKLKDLDATVADYNNDGEVSVRDAAAIARDMAKAA